MRRALLSCGAIAVAAAAWAAVSACNQTLIQTPIRVFDRPTDVALVCAEFRPSDGIYDVHPLSFCDQNLIAQTVPDMGALSVAPPLGPNPQFQFLMGLITQSARGEVALADAWQNRVVSLQPRLPGYGFLPVGLDPEHIRATSDGCLAVTGNVDSCDYGVIDVPSLINSSQPTNVDAGALDMRSQGEINVVRRIVATVPDGKGGARVLPSRPRWIEIAPDGAAATHGYEPGGVPGLCLGGAHYAWAALPTCELVVKLKLDAQGPAGADPTTQPATVTQAIRVTRAGTHVLSDAELAQVSCPAECAGSSAVLDGGVIPPPPDLSGPGDLGAPPLVNTNQSFPGTIAVDKDGGRIFIGDLYGERIDIIPVDASTGALGTPRAVQLEHGATGVSVVRVSPRSYAGQFLYAVARDQSVRVIDLDREAECETNPDPRYSGNGINLQDPAPPIDPQPMARQLGCLPLGDPNTPPRAWYATSPGIQLLNGELPKDVAFVHVETPPGSTANNVAPPAAAPGVVVGDFAWIISSQGRGTVVDIYDSCPQPNQQDENNATGPFTPSCALGNAPLSRQQTLLHYGHPQPLLLDRLSHRVRTGHIRFAQVLTPSDPSGMPRVVDEANPFAVSVPLTSSVVDGGVSGADAGASPTLPGLYAEQLPPSAITGQDTVPTRVIRFVDPDLARNEIWSVAWEEVIPGTSRPLGQPLAGGYFVDSGGAWCGRGVLKNDKLIYNGCNADTDCDYVQLCVHDPGAPPDVLSGLCLPVDPDVRTIDYWTKLCGPLLRAQRKYRILSARQHQPLPDGVLLPPSPSAPPDMGPMSPTQPTDWLKLAEIYEPEYAVQTQECKVDADCAQVTVPAGVGAAASLPTRCLQDSADNKLRCLLGCDTTKGDDGRCGTDFECATSTFGDQRCMRSPLDDNLIQQCFIEMQPYEIHVGNEFMAFGSSTGYATYEQPDANGECVVPPQTSEAVRLRQARIPLVPPQSCALASPLDSIDRTLQTNVCQVPNAVNASGVEVIHWENGVFNIAVTVPTDSSGVVQIPPDGTAVSFTLTGGGTPLSEALGIDVQAQDPTAALVSPDHQTVYVVDAGKTNTAAGLRGQVLRLFTPTQAVDHLFVIR